MNAFSIFNATTRRQREMLNLLTNSVGFVIHHLLAIANIALNYGDLNNDLS